MTRGRKHTTNTHPRGRSGPYSEYVVERTRSCPPAEMCSISAPARAQQPPSTMDGRRMV